MRDIEPHEWATWPIQAPETSPACSRKPRAVRADAQRQFETFSPSSVAAHRLQRWRRLADKPQLAVRPRATPSLASDRAHPAWTWLLAAPELALAAGVSVVRLPRIRGWRLRQTWRSQACSPPPSQTSRPSRMRIHSLPQPQSQYAPCRKCHLSVRSLSPCSKRHPGRTTTKVRVRRSRAHGRGFLHHQRLPLCRFLHHGCPAGPPAQRQAGSVRPNLRWLSEALVTPTAPAAAATPQLRWPPVGR